VPRCNGCVAGAARKLDDEPLGPASAAGRGAFTIGPGALAPDTDHVLRLRLLSNHDSPVDGDMRDPIEIAFHTGAATAVQPATPTVLRHQVGASPASMQGCREIIRSQDCIDTGVTWIEFDVAPSTDAVAWVVQGSSAGVRTVSPGGCGEPAAYAQSMLAFGCYDVFAIGVGGKLSDKTQHCVEDPGDDAAKNVSKLDDAASAKWSEGCNVACVGAGTGSSALSGLLATLAFTRCVRRPRRPRDDSKTSTTR
jgi:hypothetical protein